MLMLTEQISKMTQFTYSESAVKRPIIQSLITKGRGLTDIFIFIPFFLFKPQVGNL